MDKTIYCVIVKDCCDFPLKNAPGKTARFKRYTKTKNEAIKEVTKILTDEKVDISKVEISVEIFSRWIDFEDDKFETTCEKCGKKFIVDDLCLYDYYVCRSCAGAGDEERFCNIGRGWYPNCYDCRQCE